MNGSERGVRVEERANRILSDERAAAAHAAFVETQLRYREMRASPRAGLCKLGRILTLAAVRFLSAGTISSPALNVLE